MSEGALGGDRALTRVEDYRGETRLLVAATQHDPPLTAAERARVLGDWIRFLSSTRTGITDLEFTSRVPQALLDATAGQPQLRTLWVKWGPYADLSALSGLADLTTLRLGGATKVVSLGPLRDLVRLESLTVSEVHGLDDITALGSFSALRTLVFGNAYPGSDKTVVIPNLAWLRSLQELRSLSLPGTRLSDADLSPILELPQLRHLSLPLRRQYRKQVFELAAVSPVFAEVAQAYTELDDFRARMRN